MKEEKSLYNPKGITLNGTSKLLGDFCDNSIKNFILYFLQKRIISLFLSGDNRQKYYNEGN
jgi:vancomycin permeability regulator SanA